MRAFQNILHELKDVVSHHRPGDLLKAPSSLSSVQVNGRRLHYAAMGLDQPRRGPAIILLHGFGGFFMDWPRVMAQVGRHAHVYALDLPGWGFSEINPDSKSLEDDVSAVRQFTEQLGLESFIVCGLSYGAGVTWAAASMGLRGLKHAVLLNPMPPHPLKYIRSALYLGIFKMNQSRSAAVLSQRLMRKSHYKMICRENLFNDRLLDSFYLDLAFLVMKQPKMPFILNAHAQGAHKMDWSGWEERLADTRVPVSILHGKDDRIFSLDAASRLYELIPGSELIEVADCGHAMVFDQHRKVAEFLLQAHERATVTAPEALPLLTRQSG